MKGKKTATDEEIRAALDEGRSARAIASALGTGLQRVRDVRDGVKRKGREDLRDAIFAWCNEHDLSGLTPAERAAAIHADLGCSVSAGLKWERRWRQETGDTAKEARGGKPTHRDTIRARLGVEPAKAEPPAATVERVVGEADGDMGEAVSVPAKYLAALEAVAILTHLLDEARQ